MQGKLDPRFRSVNLYATLFVAFFTAACVHPARHAPSLGIGSWTTMLGGSQRTPFLLETSPENPMVRWEGRFGRGYTDVPFVSKELLIAGSTAKTITVADPMTGQRYWEHRVSGVISGSVLRVEDHIYTATQSRDGRVDAWRLDRGRHSWAFKMHAPATGGPVIVDNTMFVGSERAELFALNIEAGAQQWRVRIPSPLAATPVAWGADIIIVTTHDSLMRIDRRTGALSPGIHLSGSISAPITLTGDRMLIPVQPGTVNAIHLPDLRIEWSATLGAPILAAPALDTNGDIYVLTRAADVWRITNTGNATRIAALGGAAAASLTLCADGIIVGKLDGSLIMMKRDGTLVWQRNFTHSVRSPVAVRNGSVYVPLGDGHMVMMR